MIRPISIKNNAEAFSFRSTGRTVFRHGVKYSNKTCFFRGDFAWNDFVYLISQKYKNVSDVNFINLACSDGSEPWSLAILMIERLADKADKFFPIHAFDFDKVIIEQAKNKPCGLTDRDMYAINRYTKDKFNHYLSIEPFNKTKHSMAVRPKEFVNKNVIFECLNLIDSLKRLQPKNNIIMCRNMWAYLKQQDRKILTDALDTLDSSSIVAIGQLDNGHHFNNTLKDLGFVEYPINNVYVKL